MARPIHCPADWPGAHVVSIKQLNLEAVNFLCGVADSMRAIVEGRGSCKLLEGKILANVFYEPSTRTSTSFAAAMQRLGGSVLQINESTSSAVKGETLHDTIRCLSCYADALVLRHPLVGSAATASAASTVPVLNAGDGVGEHPTQALLDLYTIVAELGGVEGRTVTLLGDLKHGRTVHSLARLLALFPGVRLRFVSPPELPMPPYLLEELAAQGVAYSAHASLSEPVANGSGGDESVIAASDVLYVTRVQKERFSSADEYERLAGAFIITPATLAAAKERMVVMHPLPRVGEIDVAVDSDPRAAYFRQMRHGLYVRMALLALCLGCTAGEAAAAAMAVREA